MGPPTPPVHNGTYVAARPQALGPGGLIDRAEYVRLLEQALRALGYDDVAAQLEAASGVVQQPPAAAAFRSAVLGGQFDAALCLLPSVAADARQLDRARFLLLKAKYVELMESGATAAALQVLRTELQPLHVQQQVLHSLAALLLRPPAAANGSAPPAGGGAAGDHSSGRGAQQIAEARAVLLDELQDSLQDSLLIPERRLEELVEQALLSQLERCQYCNSRPRHLSLFSDYQAGAEQIPTQAGQVLEEHSSEVWSIVFSPCGQWAASASKDGTALLWSVTPSGRFESPRRLLQLSVACQLVSFSPDSRLILTAAMDSTVRLHDVASAKLLHTFPAADADSAAPAQPVAGAAASSAQPPGTAATVMAVSWFPDSRRFLMATHRGMAVFDSQEQQQQAGAGGSGALGGGAPPQRAQRLPCAHSYVYDAVVGPGGGCVISVGQDRKIAFLRLSDMRLETLAESGAVTSIHLSPCGRFLTANLSDSCIHVWQLPDGLAGQHPASSAAAAPHSGGSGGLANGAGGSASTFHPHPPAHSATAAFGLGVTAASDPFDYLPTAALHELRMAGSKPSRYVLRSCVGGAASGFVAGGAEDCQVYLWSRRSGELLECLAGHSGSINATAWHPTNPWLLASASDDGTIRTWLAPAALR